MSNLKVNSLVSRMLAAGGNGNLSPANIPNSINLNRNEDERRTSNESPSFNSTRRNLFGIRLNHDQLKQDLKEMWKDQIERQKRDWNFDFEKLKPISVATASSSSNNLRFEWNKVNTKNLSTASIPGIVLSSFDQDEIDGQRSIIEESRFNYSEEDHQSSEEEEDDALAIPAFYKYQRRQKLNEEQNRLKFMLTFSSPKINKPNASVNLPPPPSKQNVKKIVKSVKKNSKVNKSKVKLIRNVQSQTANGENKNLIITFSENRKDTLRSAATPRTNTISEFLKKSSNQSVTSQNSSTLAKSGLKSTSNSSLNTLNSNMKQQSLLDMLKQRKRKNSGPLNAVKPLKNEQVISNALPIVHNLRPRTTSIN